jgi:hypothetical protein
VAGRSYSFALTANGQKTTANLKIAHTPQAVFPENIVATEPARATWTLDRSASSRLAAAGSGDMQDEEDMYYNSLYSGARSFTFPARCVPGWRDGETFVSLAIFNGDVTIVGKTLILISNGLARRDYQD